MEGRSQVRGVTPRVPFPPSPPHCGSDVRTSEPLFQTRSSKKTVIAELAGRFAP